MNYENKKQQDVPLWQDVSVWRIFTFMLLALLIVVIVTMSIRLFYSEQYGEALFRETSAENTELVEAFCNQVNPDLPYSGGFMMGMADGDEWFLTSIGCHDGENPTVHYNPDGSKRP